MSYTHNLVAIVAKEHLPQTEALGIALGHSGQEFTRGVKAAGASGITHYGLSAWITSEVAAVWSGQVVPQGTGYTPEQIAGIRSLIIIDIEPVGSVTPSEQFNQVCRDNGLTHLDE